MRRDAPTVRFFPGPTTGPEESFGISTAGLTVRDVARRYRVGPDKVRAWIGRGELQAINTANVRCGRPRWVIPAEALVEFERARRGGPAPKLHRRRRRPPIVDFYPG